MEALDRVENSDFQLEVMVWFQYLVVLVAAGVSTVTDLRTRKIPNLITLPLILTGPIVLGIVYGWSGVLSAFLGLLLLGVPYIVIWLASGGGAGDAKLMMGIGAWVGPAIGIWMLLSIMIAGGIFALVAAAIYGRLRELPYSVIATLMRVIPGRRSPVQPATEAGGTMGGESKEGVSSQSTWIPFAPVILIGTAVGGVLWAIYARR